MIPKRYAPCPLPSPLPDYILVTLIEEILLLQIIWDRMSCTTNANFLVFSLQTAAVLSPKQASRLLTGLVPFLVKALACPPSRFSGGNTLFSSAARRRHMGKYSDRIDAAIPLPRPPPVSEAAVVTKEITEAEVLRVLCRLMETTANVNLHLGCVRPLCFFCIGGEGWNDFVRRLSPSPSSKVLELFSIVDSRISRALLCSAAGVAAARITQSLSDSSLSTQLLACLADVYIVKQGMASQLPVGLFNALRSIRSQRVDSSSITPGAPFEKNVLYKLLCMV